MNTLKGLFILPLLLPLSLCYAEPATPGTVLTFYISDSNLSTAHKAVMTISTAGLVDFTINGFPVSGPSSMIETGIDTGVFQVQLTLPASVNGKPLQDGDVVVMTYHQSADYSGNPTTLTQSKVLNRPAPSQVSSSVTNVRIGQYFKLHIYDPNFNRDSFRPDDIPLGSIEFHMGGLQTTLANPAFDTTPYTMRETGPNTDTFEVLVKIPKVVNGLPIEMGSTLEFRFEATTMPSSVYVKVGGTSGSYYGVPSQNIPKSVTTPMITFHATNSIGINVNFLNSSLLYDLKSPVCDPSSGSFFMMGKTTVTCAAKDQNRNSIVKSFVVNVVPGQNKIPFWTKKTIGFWCGGFLDDKQLYSTLKYLVSNGIVSILNDSENSGQTLDKTTLCLWADGKVSDQDVAKSLYWLSR